MNSETRELLQSEIVAADGSFVAGVRFFMAWDSAKFVNMCRAMHDAARANTGNQCLARDVSQLFWYCGTFLPTWLDQRDFRTGQSHVDYDKVKRILRALGNEWFGEESLIDDQQLESDLQSI